MGVLGGRSPPSIFTGKIFSIHSVSDGCLVLVPGLTRGRLMVEKADRLPWHTRVRALAFRSRAPARVEAVQQADVAIARVTVDGEYFASENARGVPPP